MSDQDSWQVELTVAPGELDNFRTLTERWVECTRGEPGDLEERSRATLTLGLGDWLPVRMLGKAE